MARLQDLNAHNDNGLQRIDAEPSVTPQERAVLDRDAGFRQGEFTKGLRRAAYNASQTTDAFVGSMAEPYAPSFADRQFEKAEATRRNMPNLQPKVESYRDVDSVGSAIDYGASTLGEAATSIGGMVAAGLAARLGLGGALRLGAAGKNAAQYGGSMAAMLPQEGGETALSLRNNPEAMANTTPEERRNLALGRGTVNSALESVVPNLLLTNTIAGTAKRIAAGARPALGNIARKSAAGVVGEGATEGAQELTGQYAENLAVPGTGYDRERVMEAAVRGAISGGVLGGAGGTIQAARSNIDAAAETAAEAARERVGTADQIVERIDNFIRNPEQAGFDMTEATMGAVAEAAARAEEVGSEVADRAGPAAARGIDAIAATKGRMDEAIMGQLTPENVKKYRELTKNFRLLAPSEYEILRDALETGDVEQINEAVSSATKLFAHRVPKETLEGLKNLTRWGKKFSKGVTRAARDRKASVDKYQANDIKKFRFFLHEKYPAVLRDMDSTGDSDTLAKAFMTMRDSSLAQLEKGKQYEDDAGTKRNPFWLNDRDRAVALYFDEHIGVPIQQMLKDAIDARNETTTRAEKRDLLRDATVFSSPTENLSRGMEHSLSPELRDQYEEAGTPIGPGAIGTDPDVVYDDNGNPMNQEDTRKSPINSLGSAQRILAADMLNGKVIYNDKTRHDPAKVIPSKLSSPDVPPSMIGELLQGKDAYRKEDGKYDRRSVPIDDDTIAMRIVNDDEGNPVAYQQDFNTADIAGQAGTPQERGGSKENSDRFVPDFDGSNNDLNIQSFRLLAMISSMHTDGIDIPRSDVDPALLEKYGLDPDGDDIHINVDMPPQSLNNKTVVQVRPGDEPNITIGDLNGFYRNAKSLQSQMELIDARYNPDEGLVDTLVDLQETGTEKEQSTAEATLKGLRSFVGREESARGLRLPRDKGEKDALTDSYVPQYHQYLAERVGSSALAQRNRRNQNLLYNALRDEVTTPERVREVIDVLSSPFIQPEGRVLTDAEQRIQAEQEVAEDKAMAWARGLELEYDKTDIRDLVDTLVEFQENGLQSFEMYQAQFNQDPGTDPDERTTIDQEFDTYARTGGRTPMAGIAKQNDARVRASTPMTIAHQRQVAETLPTKLKALVDEQAPFLYDPAVQQLEFDLPTPLRYQGREFLDIAHIGASYRTYTSSPVLDEAGEPTGFEVKAANVAEDRLGPFSQKAYDDYVVKHAAEQAKQAELQAGVNNDPAAQARLTTQREEAAAASERKARLDAEPVVDPERKSPPAPQYPVTPREADLVVRNGWSQELDRALQAATTPQEVNAVRKEAIKGQDAANIAGINETALERLKELKKQNSVVAEERKKAAPMTETPVLDITDVYPDPWTGDQVLEDDQLQLEQMKHLVNKELITVAEGNMALEGLDGQENRKRGSSLNPEWFQENDDMRAVGVEKVREIVKKYAAGKAKLGVRQQRIIDALKAQLEQEQADDARQGAYIAPEQEQPADAIETPRQRIERKQAALKQQRAQEKQQRSVVKKTREAAAPTTAVVTKPEGMSNEDFVKSQTGTQQQQQQQAPQQEQTPPPPPPPEEGTTTTPPPRGPNDPPVPPPPPPPDDAAMAKFRKIVQRMLAGRVEFDFGANLPEGMAAEYVPGRTLDDINEERRGKLLEADRVEAILNDPSNKTPFDELADPATLRTEAKALTEEAKAFRADLAVRGTIRVALGMEAQAGLAEHEAFHAAFDVFFGQGNKEDRKVVNTAFTRGVLSNRLMKYFEGNEAVLAVIDPTSKEFRAEEAAAYAFQVYLHEPGALQMGQKMEGIFNRFLQYLQKLFGYKTYEDRAKVVFDDLATGRRSERGVSILRNRASMEESMLERSRGFARELGTGIMHMYDTVLSSSYDRLEASGNPAMAQIARLGYNETGQRGQGMLQLERLNTTKFSNQMKVALHALDADELGKLNEAMILGQDLTGKLAEPQRRLRALFKEAHKYQVDAGIDDLGFQDDYYPMIWSPEKVAEDAQGFVEMLNDKYAEEMDLSMMDAEEIRDSILAFEERGHEFQGIFNKDGEPSADSSKRRHLSFIKHEDRLKYMEDDLVTTVAHYLNQSVRHAEYVRAYGRNGAKLKELMGEITGTYGGTQADVALSKDYIDGLMGNKEVGMSRELKDLYGAATVYQNVRLLPLNVFSSLVDVLGIAVRTQDMGAAFDAFGYSIRNMFTDFRERNDVNWTPEMWEQFADDMGTIDMSGTVKSIDKIYTGVTLRGKTQEINDGFFKWNLLNGWVKNNHIMATKAAQLYLRRNAEGEMFTGKMRDENLAEVGVSAEDIVYDESLGRIKATAPELLGYQDVETMEAEATAEDIKDAREQADRIQQAIHKIVRQSMIQPSSAEMPGWMSNPYLAPIAHLKTFVFGFNATILQRLLYEAKRGNYSPLYYAAAYVPGMIAADFIKGFAGNAGEEPEWKKNWGVSDYLDYGVERSGLLGTGQFFRDMNNDVSRGGGGWETLAGPSVEQATDLMGAMNAKTSAPSQRWMLDAMPANALYDQWVMP